MVTAVPCRGLPDQHVLLDTEILVELDALEGATEPCPAALMRLRDEIFRPSNSTVPVPRWYPVIASSRVVFPAPFGPSSPERTSNETESTATTPP